MCADSLFMFKLFDPNSLWLKSAKMFVEFKILKESKIT